MKKDDKKSSVISNNYSDTLHIQELQKAAQLSMVKPRGDLSCPSSEQVLAVENGLKQVEQSHTSFLEF